MISKYLFNYVVVGHDCAPATFGCQNGKWGGFSGARFGVSLMDHDSGKGSILTFCQKRRLITWHATPKWLQWLLLSSNFRSSSSNANQVRTWAQKTWPFFCQEILLHLASLFTCPLAKKTIPPYIAWCKWVKMRLYSFPRALLSSISHWVMSIFWHL